MTKHLMTMTVVYYFTASVVHAASCVDYPLQQGLSVEETANGPRIMSTAMYDVAIDDRSEVLSSLRAGDLIARAEIARFMNETIQSEQSLSEAVDTKIQIVGEERNTTRDTIREQLLSIKTRSEEVLRGVKQIGSCYEPGKYVMVTVGMSPNSVDTAQDTEAMVEGTLEDQSESSEQQPAVSAADDGAVAGFSNTEGIEDFVQDE